MCEVFFGFVSKGWGVAWADSLHGWKDQDKNTQSLWHWSVKAKSCRAVTCYTSLGVDCLPAPLTFWPLGGSDIPSARRLWLLIQEVVAKGEVQHFLVSEL